VDNLYGSMVLLPALKNYFNNCKIDNLVVLSPDMGSSKLNQRYAKWLSSDFALVDKRRYEHNQSEVVAVVGNPENKHILMVDDIIDTAGTIINAAKVAKERGALSVTVAATHGVFSGDAIQKIESSDIDKIFITDTIAENNRKLIDKIEMISSSKVSAKAITRVHSGGSVSELSKTRNIQ
jgi:ribose-phosphate pyrophosphokinase